LRLLLYRNCANRQLGKTGSLERVPHQEYQSEDLLQDIVDRHPELIVGEQINADDPSTG